MQRRPTLVVAAVDVGPAGDQELHHVQVVVDASLEEEEKVLGEVHASVDSDFNEKFYC